MYNEPNGYCVFNNAAIAIRHALDVLGLERVLLVDWDVHHGQGLQYAFYDDPRYVKWSCAYNFLLLTNLPYPHIAPHVGSGAVSKWVSV